MPDRDIAAIVDDLRPRLLRCQIEGWAGSVALGISGVIFLWLTFSYPDALGTSIHISGILGVLALFGAAWMVKRARRGHEKLLMPQLAQTLDLDYLPESKEFLHSLPPRMLPRAAHRTAEDILSGRIGGREIRFGEVKVESGGRHSRVLFDGVVMEFRNAVSLPVFLMVAEGETRGLFGMAGRIEVKDLIPLDSIHRGGETYGIWSTAAAGEAPALRAVLDILTSLAPQFGADVRLYSALSDGARTWVAIRQKRDLFRIGGLIAGRDKLLSDITRAYEDMTQPLRIVQALLEAEEKAGKR